MEQIISAVVVAAGSSTRMGFDKLRAIVGRNGESVLQQSATAFAMHPAVKELVFVYGENEDFVRAVAATCSKPVICVRGGSSRAESAANGVRAATGTFVAVHDAARPFVTQTLLSEAFSAVETYGAVAPAVPVKDTIKMARAGDGKCVPEECAVSSTPDRNTLYAVQTPQCFSRAQYLDALARLTEAEIAQLTDDCSLFEKVGLPVCLTQGAYSNLKITTKEDLPLDAMIQYAHAQGAEDDMQAPSDMQRALESHEATASIENSSTISSTIQIDEKTNKQEGNAMRIGHGYDVHKLVEGRKLILGGVEIPYEKGLLGHSDADVLVHAVMDALLGAAALGDIGKHFPDTAEEYAGADSLVLAAHVHALLAQKGYAVGNIDATIICQKPKLAPHIEQMRQNIARTFQVPVDAVNVKATTEEKLGFTGEGQGIAAHAVALLV